MTNHRRLFSAILPALLLACSGSAPTAEHRLREAFPAQAALVLESGDGFSPGARGFVHGTGALPGAWSRVAAELPGDAAGEIVFHASGGLEVRVREIGASGEGVPAGRALAYRRAGGASFWTAGGGVVEEWLHAEPGAAASGGALAAWEVEGAAVQQRDDGIALVDGAGVTRIRVTAPLAFEAGGRPIQATLEAHGARVELHVEPTALAVLVDPAWSAIAPMPGPRYAASAVLLPDGEVLVDGGQSSFGTESTTAVRYDPATKAWAPAGTMSEPQYDGFLALLGNGEVLVAGGLNGNPTTATSELYDPQTHTWSPTGAMLVAQSPTGGALLPSGEVMISGGYADPGGATVATVELYDPTTGTWSAAAPMSTPRDGHSVTVLQGGKVLVAGGLDQADAVLDTAEIYDPATDTWTPAAPMHTARFFHTATLLVDHTVLVTGGSGDLTGSAVLADVEIYDPIGDTWTVGPSLAVGRTVHTATRLGDGTVLVSTGSGAGNTFLTSTERYDWASKTWLDAGTMSIGRLIAGVAAIDGSTVLFAGGYDGTNTLSTAELFQLVPNGGACAAAGECANKVCVDGVCCDGPCDAAACLACTKAKGATADGTCSPVTGPSCVSPNPCDLTASCVAGVCTALTSVSCASLDPCHPGACDPKTGVCAFPAAPDGMSCDDHDLCTQHSTCQSGLCIGQQPVICAAKDDCHDAVCDPATGTCLQQKRADGAPCDDHSVCTLHDTCVSGACTGGVPVVCAPADSCHAAGVCEPDTGCTNPVLPSCTPVPPGPPGASPDGELCAADAECAHGHCVRGVCCDAACTDECSSCALPTSRGKCTAEPEGIDLDQDCGAAANCVSTCGGAGACVGAKQGTQCLPSRCVDDHHGLGPATCPFQGAPCPEEDSVPFDCGRYACQAALGACATSCRTVADCAPGSVCDATYRCVPPPDVAGGSDNGCQHAPGAPAGGGAALGFLLALAAASRRRR